MNRDDRSAPRHRVGPGGDRPAVCHERLAVLVEAWLDGSLDDAGLAELERLLLESAEARREFWRRAAFHGLLREAVKIAAATPPHDLVAEPEAFDSAVMSPREADSSAVAGPVTPSQVPPASPGLAAAGIAVLLFGGCCLGSLATSLAFAYAPSSGRPSLAVVVHEEGFERPPAPLQAHIPKEFDTWGGDETAVVGREGSVSPRTGGGMLRFLSGHPEGAEYVGAGSEIWRIIDLEEVRTAAGTRDVRVELAAFCNGADPGFEPLRFWLSIIATDTRPDRLGDRWADQILAADSNPASIAAAQTRDAIDADPSTWERLATSVTVPAKARYLLLHCAATLTDTDDAAGRRPRHYVDDITVTAEPCEQRPPRAAAKPSDRGRP